MRIASLLFGLVCCLAVFLDAFQTIVLPRRPSGRLRITRLFYLFTWTPWTVLAQHIGNRRIREQIYSTFGPLSLIFLLVVWALLLITGFALIFFALGSPFSDPLNLHQHLLGDLRTDLYVSGTTLFTLGLGDVVPQSVTARSLLVLESGTGLGFVALVIGYLPVIYQAFSRREVNVALLDGRAGSPPTASELLARHGYEGGERELIALLAEWERWSAEILESHISYPILCYYRSQHDNQSWLSALVAITDACALLITTVEGPSARQAHMTFAMARHALVDLGHVFQVDKKPDVQAAIGEDRLAPETFRKLCDVLGDMHLRLCGDPAAQQRLASLRLLYEPHAKALAAYLRMPLPLWIAVDSQPVSGRKKVDPWKMVAGLRRSALPEPSFADHVSSRSTAANLHDEEHGF